MARKHVLAAVLLFVLGALTALPAFAGSAVIGAAVAGRNASVSGESLVPGFTIFSGDNLKVGDGSAVVTMGKGSRMVFGRDTVASFERQSNEVTALLSQGSVSIYHPFDDGTTVRLSIGNLTIAPAPGFKTMGQVAMAGTTLVVSTNDGLLRVEGTGQTLEVPKGKTLRFQAKNERAPQGSTAGGAQKYGSDKGWIFALIGAGVGTAALIEAIYAHNDVHDATAAALQADADAKAALAAAQQANAEAVNVGCTLNKLFPSAPPASMFVPIPPDHC